MERPDNLSSMSAAKVYERAKSVSSAKMHMAMAERRRMKYNPLRHAAAAKIVGDLEQAAISSSRAAEYA